MICKIPEFLTTEAYLLMLLILLTQKTVVFPDILSQHRNTNRGKDIFIEQVTLTSAPQTPERWTALHVHRQSHLKAHPNMGWGHLIIQS